jgi:hypothetical protein
VTTVRSRSAAGVAAATVLSWLGLVVHNIADLPGQTLLSPETALPTVVYLVLLSLRLRSPRPVTDWLLLGWGSLHMIGGAVLSVLPLAALPFEPEQTVRHYTFHVVYGALQVPLLVVLIRSLRRSQAQARSARPNPVGLGRDGLTTDNRDATTEEPR